MSFTTHACGLLESVQSVGYPLGGHLHRATSARALRMSQLRAWTDTYILAVAYRRRYRQQDHRHRNKTVLTSSTYNACAAQDW